MTQAEFFAIADKVLEENSRTKCGWEGETPEWHLRRLRQEVNELAEAVRFGKRPGAIAREAADVANFAYFIAATYADDFVKEAKT